MSLICPHCHQPFILTAVAAPVARPGVPVAVATQREDYTFPPPPPTQWLCPVHRRSKVQPAGVSKKSGKPYRAFWACTEPGCDETAAYRGEPLTSPAPAEPLMPFPPMEPPLEEIG